MTSQELLTEDVYVDVTMTSMKHLATIGDGVMPMTIYELLTQDSNEVEAMASYKLLAEDSDVVETMTSQEFLAKDGDVVVARREAAVKVEGVEAVAPLCVARLPGTV